MGRNLAQTIAKLSRASAIPGSLHRRGQSERGKKLEGSVTTVVGTLFKRPDARRRLDVRTGSRRQSNSTTLSALKPMARINGALRFQSIFARGHLFPCATRF